MAQNIDEISEFEIIKISLHLIDVENEKIETIDVDLHQQPIVKYVKNLIENDILTTPDKRKYTFKDGSTQVKSSIEKIINNDDDIEAILQQNAQRLLEKEIKAEKMMAKMNRHIQRGSLLHIHFKQNERDRLLICKAEHDEILNVRTFDINRGLNIKKKVFKAFLIYLETEEFHQELYVNDKHNSKYWWEEFLELNQSHSDEVNTEKTVDKIVSIINRQRKKQENKLDSAFLKNNTLVFFRSNEHFNLTEFIDTIKEYKPFNKDYPIDKIILGFEKLKDNNSFDNQFKIIPEKIGKNKTNSIKLGQGIYLNLENNIDNLEHILQPYNVAGAVGLTIISDEAWHFIKQMNNEN
jgi:hypothetical protein